MLSEVSRVIAPLLALYGIFRAVDLSDRGAPISLDVARRNAFCSGWRSGCS